MFTKRIGLGKAQPEVLQDAFFKKERPNRNKEGWEVGNLHCPFDDCSFKLSAEGKRNTSNVQNMDGCKICFICGHVANSHGVAMKNYRILQGVWEPYSLPHRCTEVSAVTKH